MGFLDTLTSVIQKANELPSSAYVLPSSAKQQVTIKEAPQYSSLVVNPETLLNSAEAPENTSDYQNLFSQASTVYRAVGVISQSIAQLPVKVMQTNSDGEQENISHNPEFQLLKTYNEYHTHFDFWEQVFGYLELSGECPILFKRDTSGMINGLFPIRPDLISVVPSTSFLVDHYVFNSGGHSITIPRDELLFLKYFNPNSALRGLSPISAAKNDIVLDLHASTSAKNQFRRGAQPSGMISTEQDMSEGDWERTQRYLKQQYTGAGNAGRIMFLSHGLKWQQTSISNTDMQFMEQRQWTRDTISAVYGVPPIFLMQFKEASVLANADVQYKLLWENIKPKLIKIEQIFTEFILPQATTELNVSFKFELKDVSPLQPDYDKRAQRYKTGFAIGAVTPNEYLKEVLDKDPVDDPAMNLHYIPANVITLDNASTNRTGGGEVGGETDTEPSALESITEGLNKLRPKNLTETIRQSIKDTKNKMITTQQKVDAVEQLGELERLQNKIIDDHLPVFVKIVGELKKEVLKKVHTFKKYEVDKVLEKDFYELFTVLRFLQLFQDAGGAMMLESIKLAGEQMASRIGYGKFDINDPQIDAFVNERSIQYATIVTDTFVKDIDSLVRNGLTEGLTINEIATGIEGFFDSQSAYRAERIARTEAVRSTNKARLLSMQQGKVTYHMWVSQRDGRVRDSHGYLDGEIVPVGEDFPVGSGYGGDASYPSDINERCGTIPVEGSSI
jgi:HK97 family phage portal protein